jgi:RHS repeat-associated protein
VVKDIHGVVILDTHFLYDLDGNLTTRTDGDGNVTSSIYLGDQLMHQEVRNAAGQQASSVDFTYDHDGYAASETDGDGNTTVYTRDVDGNVLSMTTPLGTTVYHYDKDGNRTFLLDPLGRSIVYAYDGNRLATAIWYNANGSTANVLSYGYDEDGNLTNASNNSGSYTFHYDGDELTQEVTPAGVDINFTQHDEQGNATHISDSFGATVTAHYNADGRLDHTTYSDAGSQAREDMVYDNAGLLVSQSRYADTAGTTLEGTTAVGYHGPVLIGVLQHSDGAGIVLASFTYGYDTAGWLTSESTNGANTIGYTYDGAGQLTQAGDQTWGYDPNGNPNTGGAVVAGNNQLVSDGTWTYQYDAAGNVISRSDATAEETWTYSYDTVNELVSASETGPFGVVLVQADYSYDAFSNRITTTVTQDGETTTTRSVYVPVGSPEVGADLTHWRLWADTDGSGNLQTHYVSGDQPDRWLARVDAGADGVRWLLPDKQGSVRLVANNTEGVIDEINYNPWGLITTETAPEVGGRIAFQGGLLDRATGMIQFGPRDYGPEMRRWFEQDPLGLGPDSNPYRPMGNAPTNATDPSGLVERPIRLTPSPGQDGRLPSSQGNAPDSDAALSPQERWAKWEEQARREQKQRDAAADRALAEAQGDAEFRQALHERWLDQAEKMRADRERGWLRRFFGADLHGPTDARELDLRRKAQQVLDSKNFQIVPNDTEPISEEGRKQQAYWAEVTTISRMTTAEKLGRALKRAEPQLGPELRKRVEELCEPVNLGIMGGIVATLGVTALTPIGPAVMPVVGVIGFVMFGSSVIDVSHDLYIFVTTALGARSNADFDRAGQAFARGISKAAEQLGMAVAGVGVHKALTTLKGVKKAASLRADGKAQVAPEAVAAKPSVPTGARRVAVPKSATTWEPKDQAILRDKWNKYQRASKDQQGSSQPRMSESEYKQLYREAWEGISEIPAEIASDLEKVRRWKGTVADRTVKNTAQKEPNLEHWLKQYEPKKGRSSRATKEVDEYRKKHARWAEEGEVYLTEADMPPGVGPRHFDIANRDLQKAIELKRFQGGTRKVASINNDIRKEIAADKALIEIGWDITWVFKGYKGLSSGLKALLDAKPKIDYKIIP